MTFKYSRRVYLGDTDAAGVMYFAKGLEICHEAYEESLAAAEINLKQMLEEKIVALPIVHAEIDFLRPLFCGDRLSISLNCDRLSNNKFAVNYRISTVDNLEQVSIKAQTRHVCIHPQRRIRIDLPSSILQWLQLYNL